MLNLPMDVRQCLQIDKNVLSKCTEQIAESNKNIEKLDDLTPRHNMELHFNRA